jgi:hypothetical protein
MVYQMVRPRSNTAEVLNALNGGFAQSIKAATSGTRVEDKRTPADIFKERAMSAIADFWEGFANG